MTLKYSYLLVISILVALVNSSSATATCEIDGGSCTYKVTCKYHTGSASNPTCNDEPNVTFVITASLANVVTTSFFGATNFDSRVRSIEAINNTWTALGNLAFRYYSKTTRINLSGNFITEVQEETFKTLVPLQYLNLSNNLISELYPKSFLITDSKNTDLETLDLSNNRISHLSDEVLSYLPNLFNLYFQGNRIKTLADNCFGSQKNLITLNLEHNLIERLNMSLISLKRLKNLDLSYNYLKTISGYETNRLQALERINISNNVLQSIESNCFVQSTNLQVVDLSYNLISTAIENVLFAGNIKLEYLDLYMNRILGIEGNSFKHNKLTFLNLESNRISGEIRDHTFAGLENITKLDLSKQNVTVLRNKAFTVMRSLVHLNLSKNHIGEIETIAFYNSSLNILDVSFNNISNLFFLKDALYNLTEVYINDNNITVLHKHTFKDQVFIKKLDLSGNKILSIEEQSLPLQNMQYLSLINNRLSGVLSRDTMSPAKYLRFLDLSHFNITKIENLTFVNMPVLARLNLSHNIIEKVEPDNFKGMDNLYGLDISFNNLTDLQFNNSLLTNLKAAYLNNNKLSNISRIFPSTCNLLYLDMSHNGLSDLSYVDSKLFPELQTLHISDNNIEIFNNPRTNTLSHLLDLGLASNKIKDIDLSFFKELMVVNLSNNKLQVINNTFFKNIDYVQSMDLSRNNITDLPPGTFQNMRNLKLLNLSSNHIWKLRYGCLKGLHRTELLDVSNNNIETLDVHVFHDCTTLKTLIIDYNRIKTLDIRYLILVTQRNLKTLSLGGNPISCQEIIRNGSLFGHSFYGLNQIEVTSIHKIYHEDNVHGIKCGDDDITTTDTSLEKEALPVKSDSSSSTIIVLVWCSILTMILIGIGLVAFIKFRNKSDAKVFYRESMVQLRNSLELDGREYHVIN